MTILNSISFVCEGEKNVMVTRSANTSECTSNTTRLWNVPRMDYNVYSGGFPTKSISKKVCTYTSKIFPMSLNRTEFLKYRSRHTRSL